MKVLLKILRIFGKNIASLFFIALLLISVFFSMIDYYNGPWWGFLLVIAFKILMMTVAVFFAICSYWVWNKNAFKEFAESPPRPSR